MSGLRKSGGKPTFPTPRLLNCSLRFTLKVFRDEITSSILVSSGSGRRACPRSYASSGTLSQALFVQSPQNLQITEQRAGTRP